MTVEDISGRFRYKEMSDERKQSSEFIGEKFIDLGDIIDIHCPNNRERSLALTKLEEALMWVNKSLSKN